jgi:hypothetical protein
MSRAQLTSTVEQNSAGAAAPFVAGKNKIINGDFGVWQRGTSFSASVGSTTFGADRFIYYWDGTGGTCTYSQQTFTLGTAPVTGYEGTYFARINQSAAASGTTQALFGQKIEDVRTFAGQTITVSFWAKANASLNLVKVTATQGFGSGGSTAVETSFTMSASTITTSWVRYTGTVAVPSIAGKTIGSGNLLGLYIYLPISGTFTFDIWGVQVEAGSVATPFTTATGTLQGELAACQRYYFRQTASGSYTRFGSGPAVATTQTGSNVFFPVTMRVAPTSVDYSNLAIYDGTSIIAISSLIIGFTGYQSANLQTVVSGAVTNRYYDLLANNNTAAYVGFSAEL